MRIVGARLSPQGETFAAVLQGPGQPARILTDLPAFWAAPAAALSSAVDGAPNVGVEELTLVPPVPAGARVLCVTPGPGEQLRIDARWSASLSVDGGPIPLADAEGLRWGVGIAAFVGSVLVGAEPEDAGEAVVGYATFTDLIGVGGAHPVLSRNGDGSGPIGPLVTRDEVGDLDAALRVRVRVDDRPVHEGTAIGSAHGLASALSLVSRRLTLHPGDVVVLGMAAEPEQHAAVRAGSVVEVDVERLGTLTNPVVGDDSGMAAAH